LRVARWRKITIPITIIWGATSLRLLLVVTEVEKVQNLTPFVFVLWLLSNVYFLLLSLHLSFSASIED